jgi:hypothetical protein
MWASPVRTAKRDGSAGTGVARVEDIFQQVIDNTAR